MKGGIDWEFGIDKYTLLYLKQITNRTYCIAQGTLLISCNNLTGKRI